MEKSVKTRVWYYNHSNAHKSRTVSAFNGSGLCICRYPMASHWLVCPSVSHPGISVWPEKPQLVSQAVVKNPHLQNWWTIVDYEVHQFSWGPPSRENSCKCDVWCQVNEHWMDAITYTYTCHSHPCLIHKTAAKALFFLKCFLLQI